MCQSLSMIIGQNSHNRRARVNEDGGVAIGKPRRIGQQRGLRPLLTRTRRAANTSSERRQSGARLTPIPDREQLATRQLSNHPRLSGNFTLGKIRSASKEVAPRQKRQVAAAGVS